MVERELRVPDNILLAREFSTALLSSNPLVALRKNVSGWRGLTLIGLEDILTLIL